MNRYLRLENLEGRSLMAVSILDSNANVGSVQNQFETRIINGNVTSQFPSVGIVGDASGGFCTGTLIAPQFVLTAGHCVEGVANTAGRFTVGGSTYATSQVFQNPTYNSNLIGSDNANDIAIFKLSTPVTNVAPSEIFRSVPVTGQLLTLVGFGGAGNGSTGTDGSFGTKRIGTTPIDSVSPKLIRWHFDNNTEANTAPGDSGGPAYVNVNGSYYIAGVTSGGESATAAIGDNSFDTRVDAFAGWIDSIVGTSNPPSTTIVSIRASDASASETLTTQAANTGTYVISRTGPLTSSLSVSFAWSGTAVNGSDYKSLTTSVTIPAGAASTTLVLAPVDDALVETSETAIATLTSSTSYAIDSAARVATVSIADNDRATTQNNNMFANRIKLTGQTVATTGSNVGATRETGEPSIAGISGGKSVWWTWTAPVTGSVVVHTGGSSFDTTLGVFRGTTVSALTRVAVNDDDPTANVVTSRLTFNATAGTVYQILVDGYSGATGAIKLQIQASAARANRGTNGNADNMADSVRSWPLIENRSLQSSSQIPSFTQQTSYNRYIRRIDRVFGSGISDIFDFDFE